ncbi:MAG: HAD hydrolase family protein, partial [Muribaculaceae bacterium]|nr:HAD hydrolase family protein [Muribaculaceae bacterium]
LKLIKGIAFDVDGVLSPATVPMDSDGIPCRMANLRDGYSMVQAVKCGYHLALISGADTQAVRRRFEIIGINTDDMYLGSLDKVTALNRWMQQHSLQPQEVAYVGDDMPDIEPMRLVGLSVCPADAATDVLAVASYISPVNGGYGVARDLIEEIMKAQGTWESTTKAFGQ